MDNIKYDIGLIGLGVMGLNLAKNISDHDFTVAGYDMNSEMVARMNEGGDKKKIHGFDSLDEFISALHLPHSVILMVPAGEPVDNIIRSLMPQLEKGDLVIDAGNSHYKDTDMRAEALRKKAILYLGVGISGGEHGARYGPSIMPGGSLEAYQRVQPVLKRAAAKVDGNPCVTYLGPGSAGHYVKMVHNGIEYGFMQLIAESYDLMKHGLLLNNDQLHQIFADWNTRELNSYLIEITSGILTQHDQKTGKRLIDVILDEAKQKGTGMWTSQDAMELQVPVPNIDIAVVMRNMSELKGERHQASNLLGGDTSSYPGENDELIRHLEKALYAAMIITYSQGFSLLHRASEEYGYQLDQEKVARIWRGGCIIRSQLLEDIRAAFMKNVDLSNFLLDAELGRRVIGFRDDLKTIVRVAVGLGVPVPGLMTALAYLDSFRSAWLPANLIQAQRDYFGSHTYERIDIKGTFHNEWQADKE